MKKILLAIVALIVLLVVAVGVVSLVSPTEFKVQRDVVINKPKAEVFGYLKFLKNQNEWGPWVQKDPNIKLEYSGTDGEVGFVSKWDGDPDTIGVGEQEIKKIVDGERIETELRFIKPWEATNKGFLMTEAAGENKTKVTWGFSGEMARPMNLMLVFTPFEDEVAKDFEEGLGKLKSVLEKRPSPEAEKSEDDDEKEEDDSEKGDKVGNG